MKYGKIDLNQQAIVKTLRAIGCTVQSLADCGKGVPDLLCGYCGKNFLLEIKQSAKSKLTPHEIAWHDKWRGQAVRIVTNSDEALIAIGAISGKDIKGIRGNH